MVFLIIVLILLCVNRNTKSHLIGNSKKSSLLESIVGYIPRHDTSSMLQIDLELNALNKEVLEASDESFTNARRLYVEGIHNVSVAHLNLLKPLSFDVTIGTALKGVNNFNEAIFGTVYGRNGYVGDRELMFLYENKNTTLKCLVGSYPIEKQVISGCLARKAKVQLLAKELNFKEISYMYNPYNDNDNGLTLNSLSTTAAPLMNDCRRCPYDDYIKFRKYYGSSNYINEWIEAAFEGRATNFANGNSNFTRFNTFGRGEAIHKSAAFMLIWMSVIGKMEGAIDICSERNNCTKPNNCNPQAIQLWDDAVALYTGSLVGTEGSGLLLYSLANKRCRQFLTCDRKIPEESQISFSINEEIIHMFRLGQNDIATHTCEPVKRYKEQISRLMVVPLIQSTLYYAYINQYHLQLDKREKLQAQAEGAVFAASVLPLIYHCENADAHLIFSNLVVGSSQTDFTIVKTAFERNYDCLGLTCDEIGGLYENSTHKYMKNAYPCINPTEQDIRDVKVTFIVFFGLTGPIIVVICCFLPCRQNIHGEEITQDEQISDGKKINDDIDEGMDVLAIIDIRDVM